MHVMKNSCRNKPLREIAIIGEIFSSIHSTLSKPRFFVIEINPHRFLYNLV